MHDTLKNYADWISHPEDRFIYALEVGWTKTSLFIFWIGPHLLSTMLSLHSSYAVSWKFVARQFSRFFNGSFTFVWRFKVFSWFYQDLRVFFIVLILCKSYNWTLNRGKTLRKPWTANNTMCHKISAILDSCFPYLAWQSLHPEALGSHEMTGLRNFPTKQFRSCKLKKVKLDKAGVINDPLGQTHSLASSEH